MDAIQLLEAQHREVEALLTRLESAKDEEKKETLFTTLADKLAIHTAIEEHHFYPAVKANGTEDVLSESLEEHVGIKRLLSDLLDTDVSDETFDAKLDVLKEAVSQHVDEEENDLFPNVKTLFDEEQLEALGQEMSDEQAELEAEGNPRDAIQETEAASI